jgi:hypothetical protein
LCFKLSQDGIEPKTMLEPEVALKV